MQITAPTGMTGGPGVVALDSAAVPAPVATLVGNDVAESAACPGGLLKRDGVCSAVAQPKMTILSFTRPGQDGDRDSDADSTQSHTRKMRAYFGGRHGNDLQAHDGNFDNVMHDLLDKTHSNAVEIDLITPDQRVNSPISPSVFLAGNALKLQDGKIAYKVPNHYRPLGRSSWATSWKKRAPPAEAVEHHEALAPHRYVYTNSAYSVTSCDYSDRHDPRCRGRVHRHHRFWHWKRDAAKAGGAFLHRRGREEGRRGRRYGRQRPGQGREWESDGMSAADDNSLADDPEDLDRRAVSEQHAAMSKQSVLMVNHAKGISPEVLEQLDSATHSHFSDDDDRHSEKWSDEWDTRTTCDHASDLDKPGCNAEKLRKNMLLSSDVHILQSAGPIAKNESGNVDDVLAQANGTSGDDSAVKADDATAANDSAKAVRRDITTPLSSELLKRATEQSLGDKADRALAREKFMKRWLAGDEKPRPFEAMDKPVLGKRQTSASSTPSRLNRHDLMKRAVGAGMLPGGMDGMMQPNGRFPSVPARKGRGRGRAGNKKGGRRRHRKGAAGRGARPLAAPPMPFAKRQVKADDAAVKPANNQTRLQRLRQGRTGLANNGTWRSRLGIWPSSPTDPYSAESEWSNNSIDDFGHRWSRPGLRRMQKRGYADEAYGGLERARDGRRRLYSHRLAGIDLESVHSTSTRPDLRYVCPGGICMRSVEARLDETALNKRELAKRGRDGEVDDVASLPDDHEDKEWDKRSHSSEEEEEECHHCHHHRHHRWWRRMFGKRGIDRDDARPDADSVSINSALSQVGRM